MPPLILKFNTHDVNDSNLRLASMLCIYAHKQLTQASPGAPSLFLLGKGMAEYSFLHKPIMHQLPTLSTSVAGVHASLHMQVSLQHAAQGGGSQRGGEAQALALSQPISHHLRQQLAVSSSALLVTCFISCCTAAHCRTLLSSARSDGNRS